MESLSGPICRGPVPWQGLLLAVSFLNFWSLPTTAKLSIVSIKTPEGKDVILRIRNMPPDAISFMWYRGEVANYKNNIARLSILLRRHRTGPAHTGREQINFDGSLQLKSVTQKDTGIYTLVVYFRGSKKEIGFGRLNVYGPTPTGPGVTQGVDGVSEEGRTQRTHSELVRVPILIASNTTVIEHKDSVVLTCHTNAVSTQWFFNGMNLRLTERMKLYWNNRILIIDPVKREDAGNYQCKVFNPISSAESVSVELDVKY